MAAQAIQFPSPLITYHDCAKLETHLHDPLSLSCCISEKKAYADIVSLFTKRRVHSNPSLTMSSAGHKRSDRDRLLSQTLHGRHSGRHSDNEQSHGCEIESETPNGNAEAKAKLGKSKGQPLMKLILHHSRSQHSQHDFTFFATPLITIVYGILLFLQLHPTIQFLSLPDKQEVELLGCLKTKHDFVPCQFLSPNI